MPRLLASGAPRVAPGDGRVLVDGPHARRLRWGQGPGTPVTTTSPVRHAGRLLPGGLQRLGEAQPVDQLGERPAVARADDGDGADPLLRRRRVDRESTRL